MTDYTPQQPSRDTDPHDQPKLAKKIKNFIYDPSDVIGSGFSSKVFKGTNEQNNDQVAIKVIQLSKIQNQVQKYLLNNQINALRALNHKNILRTIDILMTKNNVYIVTEFCQYGDLQQKIKNNKKINEKDALSIIKDIVQGYMAIQQKKLIHRDLKTANIFLTRTGAKIADFGFCEFIGQKKPQIAYNVGSPAYMSPQSYKQNHYSNKSDIWGIGIILYEMITGQTPEKNLTYTQMSTNLMNGKINCGPNESVKNILINCFKKNLNQRIQSKNLLQLINNSLDSLSKNLNFTIDEQKKMNLPIYDSRLMKNNINPIMTPNEGRRSINNNNINHPLRNSMDEKQILNSSPSKIFQPFRNNNEQFVRQISLVNPSFAQNGSRTIVQKKDLSNTPSFLISNITSNKGLQVVQVNEVSKRLKSLTIMLQFIFRLYKYSSQVFISSLPFLRLLIFRHRSHIDIQSQLLVQKESSIKNSQFYKQFQFLKLKFDQTYLQKEYIPTSVSQNHQLMNVMNQMANLSFVDHKSINAYKNVIRKAIQEIQIDINQNRSNSFVLWDYLMLEYQILTLYAQGVQDHLIVNERISLEKMLKQQPRNLSKNHIQLLKIKSLYLLQQKVYVKTN